MTASLAARSIAFVSRNILAFSAGSIATAVILGGAAHAYTDTIFKYSAPKSGFFSIHPMALGPANDSATYSIGFTDGLVNGTGCFSTGVNLPNGATITSLTVWFLSNASDDPLFYFVRHNLATGAENAFVTSAVAHDDSAERKARTFAITDTANAKVSNGQYAYGFAYCGKALQDAFLGARVAYTYTTAGD